jgi:hypothetical protein
MRECISLRALFPIRPREGYVRLGSRLCENVHEQRMRRIVFSLFFLRR